MQKGLDFEIVPEITINATTVNFSQFELPWIQKRLIACISILWPICDISLRPILSIRGSILHALKTWIINVQYGPVKIFPCYSTIPHKNVRLQVGSRPHPRAHGGQVRGDDGRDGQGGGQGILREHIHTRTSLSRRGTLVREHCLFVLLLPFTVLLIQNVPIWMAVQPFLKIKEDVKSWNGCTAFIVALYLTVFALEQKSV